MACIIRMTSDEFLDKFIKKHDYKKFNFLLISEDIKTENKYKNVYALPSLIPPPNVVSNFISEGYSEKYVKKYLDYISAPKVEALITVMVKLCFIDNSNVVLLCSEAEDEFKYIDIICQYIENIYEVETYSYKKYKKNPEKCEEVSDKTKKKVAKILEKKIGVVKMDNENRKTKSEEVKEPVKYTKRQKRAAIDMFKVLNKKTMCKLLRTNGLKHNPKNSKKDLRKLCVEEYLQGRLQYTPEPREPKVEVEIGSDDE